MKRDDTLDRARWRALLWNPDAALADGEPHDPPDDAAPTAGEPAPAEALPSIDRELLDHRAQWVEDLWRERDPAAQRDGVEVMTGKVLGGLWFGALGARHPRAAVRAVRLLVRHWHTLDPSDARFRAHGVGFGRLCHPEVADLVVETVARGDRWLAWHIDQALPEDDLRGPYPALGARLVRSLAAATTWPTRALALEWLCRGRWPEAVARLREALRWPHLPGRVVALHGLLELPEALRAEDVAWLLEDAVVHPIDAAPGAGDELRRGYEDALAAALVRCPPPDAHVPLGRIVRWDCALVRRDRRYLDPRWALAALARVRPDLALRDIDRWSRDAASYTRAWAVAAAAPLPEADARARLSALAADADGAVAEAARRAWRERFATPCPVDVLAGVPLDLLEGPPSAAFESRVLVLRGGDAEARTRMLCALDAGPATPEALALTLFALRASRSLPTSEALPDSDDGWVARLRARHGDRALAALLAEVERGPGGDRWLDALAHCAREGTLAAEDRRRLAAVATRRLGADDAAPDAAALRALAVVGASDDAVAPLWARALGPVSPTEADAIVQALVARGPDPALDARVETAFAEARAAGRWSQVELLGELGIARGLAAVAAAVERDVWDRDAPDAEPALARLAAVLEAHDRLPEARVVEALAAPGASRFVRLARKAPLEGALRARAVARLEAALASDARGGASAAAALGVLLFDGAVGEDDPRVEAVYQRACGRDQAALLYARLQRWQGDRARFHSHLRALLTHHDADVAREALELVLVYDRGRWDEDWLEALLPDIPHADVREWLATKLGYASAAEAYWAADEDDGDEDDGDEDDGDDDDEGEDDEA